MKRKELERQKKYIEECSNTNQYIQKYAKDLHSILDTVNVWLENKKYTHKQLIALLEDARALYAIQKQEELQLQAEKDWYVYNLKEVFPEKRKQRLIGINKHNAHVQLAFSNPKNYRLFNYNQYKLITNPQEQKAFQYKAFVDWIIIDPRKISQKMLDTYQCDHSDPYYRALKEKLFFARSLKYQDTTGKQTYTSRVQFIYGYPLVYRTVHTAIQSTAKPTKAEKQRFDVNKYASAYTDMFSVVRAQNYILSWEQEDIQELKELKIKLIDALINVKVHTKEQTLTRQIQEVIDELQNAQSFFKTAAKVYNLTQLGTHSTRNEWHLQWAINKLNSEITKLFQITAKVWMQWAALEWMLQTQYTAYQKFLTDLAYDLFTQRKWTGRFDRKIYEKYGNQIFTVQPFLQYWKDIQIVLQEPTSHTNYLWILLIILQQINLDIYNYEHEYKIGNITSQYISQTNPFKHKDKLPELETIQDSFFPTIEKDIQDRKWAALSMLPQDFGQLCTQYRKTYYADLIPTIIQAKSSLF